MNFQIGDYVQVIAGPYALQYGTVSYAPAGQPDYYYIYMDSGGQAYEHRQDILAAQRPTVAQQGFHPGDLVVIRPTGIVAEVMAVFPPSAPGGETFYDLRSLSGFRRHYYPESQLSLHSPIGQNTMASPPPTLTGGAAAHMQQLKQLDTRGMVFGEQGITVLEDYSTPLRSSDSREARKAEGRCIECGELRPMSAFGLGNCPNGHE